MKLLIPHIDFSSADKKRDVNLPTVLDENLAELVGIIIGDGHIGIYSSEKHKVSIRKYFHYEIHIVGNSIDDSQYLQYINDLFFSCFNIKLKYKTHKIQKLGTLRIDSKAIVSYLSLVFEIPINNKSSLVKIPRIIINSKKEIKQAFLRGIADTDFYFAFKRHKIYHTYPVIRGKFASKKLVEDLSLIIKELGFTYHLMKHDSIDKRSMKPFTEFAVYSEGKTNFLRWKSKIGFSNIKNQLKADIWTKFGYMPPYLSLNQTKEIMAGKLDPATFYGPGKI